MTKHAWVAILTVSALGVLSATALAQGTKVQNALGETLYELHIAKPNPGPLGYDWGANLLPKPIPRGATLTVDLPKALDACIYDFLVTGRDGADWEVTGVDLCKAHTITFRHTTTGGVAYSGK